jgi:hypothetical protein
MKTATPAVLIIYLYTTRILSGFLIAIISKLLKKNKKLLFLEFFFKADLLFFGLSHIGITYNHHHQ